jgi:hypothetical protein
MEEDTKQISDHHDNIIKLQARAKSLIDGSKYVMDKAERDIFYLKTLLFLLYHLCF